MTGRIKSPVVEFGGKLVSVQTALNGFPFFTYTHNIKPTFTHSALTASLARHGFSSYSPFHLPILNAVNYSTDTLKQRERKRDIEEKSKNYPSWYLNDYKETKINKE